MTIELDEDRPWVEGAGFTRDAVQARVDDWLARVRAILADTERWAVQQGWRATSVGEIPMNEEPMREFDVPPTRQPTLRLDHPDGRFALFMPIALWVLGANGQIDLYTGKGVSIIVDRAERLQPPQWTILHLEDEWQEMPYDPALLHDLT